MEELPEVLKDLIGQEIEAIEYDNNKGMFCRFQFSEHILLITPEGFTVKEKED
jgi:hypothetical protein